MKGVSGMTVKNMSSLLSTFRQSSAYVHSHNGLGDNVAMIGCLHFLANFYENVYFLCRSDYVSQMEFAVKDFPFIVIISFPYSKDENVSNVFNKELLQRASETSDLFICGNHKYYIDSKITHPYLLDISRLYQDFPDGFPSFLREPYRDIFAHIDPFYDFTYKDIDRLPDGYWFIDMFYKDIRLNNSIYIDFFHMPVDSGMTNYYHKISHYNIVFVHSASSNTGNVDIKYALTQFLDNEEFLVICVNQNYYNDTDHKYYLANQYISLPTIFHYMEIIKNAHILIMTESCFSCLTLPLIKKGLVKTRNINVFNRFTMNKISMDILYL